MSKFLVSLNPLNKEPVGQVPITSRPELTEIVDQSRIAQTNWGRLSLEERAARLRAAYEALALAQNQLSRLISLEMGKDARRATYEVAGTVQSAPYFIEEAASALQTEQVEGRSRIQYRPLGVVAVISPWNYPLAMANNLLIPALMAGNSVILKPSEHTPLVADLFVRALQDHLPENLIQIAHGHGDVGQALVKSDINMIAFTGSMATGRSIMADAAEGVKRLVMELGGNDPLIVMKDANLSAAARFAVASSFENAGQMCTSTERVYVDRSVAEEFKRQVVAAASAYQVGPWDQRGVNIGPIANATQHQLVLQHLRDAEAKGARFLLGKADYPAPFIQPTVVDGMTPDMLLEREETFGPVVAMAEFDAIEDAIARANDSIYGLGAVVFGGRDAAAVAEALEAGMVSVNGGAGGSPWVGAKQSGFGFHGSAAGHRQFAQVRVMNF